ncbi:unnamed protein product, partial [Medioppia subpectinata]
EEIICGDLETLTPLIRDTNNENKNNDYLIDDCKPLDQLSQQQETCLQSDDLCLNLEEENRKEFHKRNETLDKVVVNDDEKLSTVKESGLKQNNSSHLIKSQVLRESAESKQTIDSKQVMTIEDNSVNSDPLSKESHKKYVGIDRISSNQMDNEIDGIFYTQQPEIETTVNIVDPIETNQMTCSMSSNLCDNMLNEMPTNVDNIFNENNDNNMWIENNSQQFCLRKDESLATDEIIPIPKSYDSSNITTTLGSAEESPANDNSSTDPNMETLNDNQVVVIEKNTQVCDNKTIVTDSYDNNTITGEMESELSSMKCLHPNEGNDQNLEDIHHREEHCSDLETSTRLKRDINDENLYDADISDNINNGIESDNEDNVWLNDIQTRFGPILERDKLETNDKDLLSIRLNQLLELLSEVNNIDITKAKQLNSRNKVRIFCQKEIKRLNEKLIKLRSESPELLATNKDTQRAPKRNLLNYMSRALKASIPIQALMFILLGAASLVPTVDEDYSCQLMNNLLHSFQPMLDYPNGPPPV